MKRRWRGLCAAAACWLLLSGCGGQAGGQAAAPAEGPAPTPTPAASGSGPQQDSRPPAAPSAAAGGSSSVPAAAEDPFAGQPGYRPQLAGQYAAWAEDHPDHTAAQTVGYVNIGLDREFYTGVEEIAAPDDLLVLCNKYRCLPAGYAPQDLALVDPGCANGGASLYLRQEAATAFEALCRGAAGQGLTILGQSGYRSYEYQQQLYNGYVARDGQAAADTYSARPGFSEHQTGLAMDVCNGALPYTSFGETAEYQWAKEHLHEYGFVLHYLPDSQWVTGYMTEEWHIRYVGAETAAAVYAAGITLDEYLATH